MDVYDLLEADGAELKGRARRGITCPKCEGRTSLSVRNDNFAKCFKCGETWNVFRAGNNLRWIEAALDVLYTDFTTALASDSPLAKSAMHYLTDIRKVDEEVLSVSPVGMVPQSYSYSRALNAARDKFDRYYASLQEAVPVDPEDPKGTEIRAKAQQALAISEKDAFERFEKQLRCLGSCPSWLGFFYGEPGKFMSVKLRDTGSKDFRFIKPAQGGVFNPITPQDGQAEWYLDLVGELPLEDVGDTWVFEGEFNQLTFLSQTARAQRAAGGVMITQPSCAMGGATDWDFRALKELTSSPLVCRDNDDAGRTAVVALAKKLQTRVVTTTPPTNGWDMDDYLKYLPVGEVLPALKALFDKRISHVRSIEDVREQLNAIRTDKKLDMMVERIPAVAKVIWRDFVSRGKVFFDGAVAYYLSDRDKKLFEVTPNAEFSTLLSEYNLLSNAPITSQVIDSTGQRAGVDGIRTEVHKTAFYNKETNTCYINLGDNQMVRIKTDRTELCSNGTDGVLFLYRHMQPFDVDLDKLPTVAEGLKVSDTPLCREFNGNWDYDQTTVPGTGLQQLFLARILMMFMPQLFRGKPLVVAQGQQGSGKTALCEKVGWLLEGSGFSNTPLSSDPKDLHTVLTNKNFVLLDNVDDIDSARRHQDLLAVSATGGALSKRVLYTTNESRDFPLQASVFVSTRTNPLDRSDLADRTLLMPLARFTETNGRSEEYLRSNSLANRDVHMAEIIVRVRNILIALEAEKKNSYSTQFRMRDFMEFCLRVAHHEGWHEEMEAISKALIEDQSRSATREDPLHELLTCFIGSNPMLFDGKLSSKLELTATQLRHELGQLQHSCGVDLPFKNAKSLSYAFSQGKSELKAKFGLTSRFDAKRKANIYTLAPDKATRDRCAEDALLRVKGFERVLEEVG